MPGKKPNDYGVLVGWKADIAGERLTLKMQSVTKPPPHKSEDVHGQYFVMDKTQAVQLGTYLLELAEAAPLDRSGRGLFARLFG